MTTILGISAFYHDSAATLIADGNIVAAAQEERFSRKKHDSSYPYNAVNYVLSEANLKLSEIDHIVFFEKPFLKFERLLETYLAFAPAGFKSFSLSMPIWLREKLFQKNLLFEKLKKHDANFKDINKINFSEHHYSHAASAFYPSPFKDAIVLTLDGVGEWATTTVAIGQENNLKIIKEIHFPHSLGLLYSAFTYYTGFKVNSGEYKVMGMAPYGEPRYCGLIKDKLIKIANDGSFRLDMSYFDFAVGLTMTNKKFDKLFDGPPREFESELTQKDMDKGGSNSGDEISKTKAIKIGKRLSKKIADGTADMVHRRYELASARAKVKNDSIQIKMDKVSKECKKKHGKDLVPANYPEPYKTQWNKLYDSKSWDDSYPFNKDNVENFAKFCLESGGFNIC